MSIAQYRNTVKNYIYSPSTIKMGNWLSPYMYGRQYKYSVYKQIISVFAEQIDEVNSALERHNLNQFPHTHLDDTMDVVYVAPYTGGVSSVQFSIGDDDFTIEESPYSNVEDWWYNFVPNRIITTSSWNKNSLIYENVLQKTININSSLAPADCIFVELSGDAKYIKDEYGKDISPTVITVVGQNEFGRNIKENFLFTFPTYITSNNKWSRIYRIDAEYYDDPSLITVKIDTAYGDVIDGLVEDKHLQIEDVDGINHPMFWYWDNNKLQKKIMSANSLLNYYSGGKTLDLENEYDLLYKNDLGEWVELENPESLIPTNSFNNYIYALKDGNLLCYNKLDAIPSIISRATNLRTEETTVDLSVLVESGKLTIKGVYNILYPKKRIHSYRFLIENTSGDIVYCSDPSLTNTATANNSWLPFTDEGYWTEYTLQNTIGFHSPDIEYGDGTPFSEDLFVRLDVRLSTGVVETTTFIIEKQSKQPIFQLPMSTNIIANYSSAKLFFDKNHNLCVTDGSLVSIVDFANDSYLKDETTKQLIFAHNYGVVHTVDNAVSVDKTLQPSNVINTLDNYGACISLGRKLGEKNRTYRQRLLYAMNNSFGSSRKGLTNAIGCELGLLTANIADVSYADPFSLSIETEGATSTTDLNASSINLFDYETISDILTDLVTAGLTVDNIDTNFTSLPARCLIIDTNIKTYSNLNNINKKRIVPELLPEEYIYAVEIDGLDFVGQLNNIGELDAYTAPSCAVVSGKFIISNIEMTEDNLGYYKTVTNKMTLRANPIIISSLHAGLDYHFQYNNISEYGQYIMQQSDRLYPNKWSN